MRFGNISRFGILRLDVHSLRGSICVGQEKGYAERKRNSEDKSEKQNMEERGPDSTVSDLTMYPSKGTQVNREFRTPHLLFVTSTLHMLFPTMAGYGE